MTLVRWEGTPAFKVAEANKLKLIVWSEDVARFCEITHL